MSMTEEEARTKWCPFTRTGLYAGDSGVGDHRSAVRAVGVRNREGALMNVTPSIPCHLFENDLIVATVKLRAVPRIGEGVIVGYGENYTIFRVTDVIHDGEKGRLNSVRLKVKRGD